MNNKLLMRNNDSREKTEFICPSERREFQRCRSKPNDTMNVTPINVKKSGPIADWAKACTEESTPERVRKVPKMTREYVRMIRIIFHRLNMPFLSWIMTECRKAVPLNQGIRAAISTGSQPQYPPQPRTSYAHRLPNTKPSERKSHATRVHLRVTRIQRSSTLPVARAAIANANGTTNETNPR